MKSGIIKVKTEGGNFAAFISTANNVGISLYDIEKKENALFFACDGEKEGELRRIAARCGNIFTVIGRKDAKSRLRGIARHAGVWTALIIFVFSIVVSRFFVFSVAVTGASPELAAEITKALAGSGIDGVTAKSAIDLKKIEELAVGAGDDIAFAEAYIDGVRLVVNVREQLPEPSEDEEKGKIYASCDAIVTRVEVSGGTAAVKAGDTVRKGQILIEDKIIVGDPLDPAHKEIETSAEGDIYGRVWYTERLLIPEYRQVTVRTGNKYSSSSLCLKDKILIKADDKHGFSEYEKTTETKQLNGILPFYIVTDTYYETTTETVQTDDTYIDSEVYAAFSSLLASLDDSASVLRSYKSQKKVDNYYIIILYYEVEQLIGCREA